MPPLKRKIKNVGKYGLRKLFEVGQGFGFDILPRHFYSELADIRDLRRDDRWKEPRSLLGVNGTDLYEQLRFLEKCSSDRLKRRTQPESIHIQALRENNLDEGYGTVEADCLYCFIQETKPQKIVQVGCGVSTSVILQAADAVGYLPELSCIEPYPNVFLADQARRGRIKLVAEKAQHVPLELLTDLGENGFLFVDSTHTVKAGSEVNRIILEVMPRLKPGSYIHFHDIHFPYDYIPDLLSSALFFWSESVLLLAYLMDNPRYTILASLCMLQHKLPRELAAIFPTFLPADKEHGLKMSTGEFPSSIYLRTVA